MPDMTVPHPRSMIRTATIAGVEHRGGDRYEITYDADAHGNWGFTFTATDGVAPRSGETATFFGEFVKVDVLDINGRVYRIA